MKRQIAAWGLLAVFVPMLLLASFHVHEQGDATSKTCTECVHGQCDGHLTQLTLTMHQCVLCQFLTLTLIATATVALLIANRAVLTIPDASRHHVCVAHSGIVGLRAPPAFFI